MQTMMQRYDSPFHLENVKGYAEWRAQKLDAYPQTLDDLVVRIHDPARLTEAERSALVQACRRANLAIYTSARSDLDKADLRAFGQQLGLNRLDTNLYADEDGITALQVSDVDRKRDYIPYTNRRLNWHTDGYYNRPGSGSGRS